MSKMSNFVVLCGNVLCVYFVNSSHLRLKCVDNYSIIATDNGSNGV